MPKIKRRPTLAAKKAAGGQPVSKYATKRAECGLGVVAKPEGWRKPRRQDAVVEQVAS